MVILSVDLNFLCEPFLRKDDVMQRSLTMLVLLVAALPARAHFIWLVPYDGAQAKLIFSDSLEPDANVPITKVAATTLRARAADGKPVTAPKTEAKDHYLVTVPATGPIELTGICTYGVLAKKGDPFLLQYSARTYVGGVIHGQTNDQLVLQIVPLKEKAGAFRVLWQGKPAAGVEVVALLPGEDSVNLKTDANGFVALPSVPKNGLVGLRAKFVEAKAGELDGKTYQEVRHYATLTVTVAATTAAKTEDPAASQLLAAARAARAAWKQFPGFSADLVANHDGKLVKGTVEVTPQGKVNLTLADEALKTWARREIASLVSHRLPGTVAATPCGFRDDTEQHPQGRAIVVLNDELHSSYRIRDRQILEVNRQMGEVRFTISVLENSWNADKQYLPASYVVNTWDVKSNTLRSSAAHHNAWTRIGAFDLPTTVRVTTATPGHVEYRTLTFANHRMGMTAGR